MVACSLEGGVLITINVGVGQFKFADLNGIVNDVVVEDHGHGGGGGVTTTEAVGGHHSVVMVNILGAVLGRYGVAGGGHQAALVVVAPFEGGVSDRGAGCQLHTHSGADVRSGEVVADRQCDVRMHCQGDGIGIGGTAVVGGEVANTYVVPIHVGSLREGELYRIGLLVVLYLQPSFSGGGDVFVLIHVRNFGVDVGAEADA